MPKEVFAMNDEARMVVRFMVACVVLVAVAAVGSCCLFL